METKRSITLDEFKRPILTIDQAIDLLLCGKDIENEIIEDCSDVNLFNEYSFLLEDKRVLINSDKFGYNISSFHNTKINEWCLPDHYLNMEVMDYVLSLCVDDIEIERVKLELSMFEERGMMPLLKLLIYLVDHFRENNYVWGVGRGSSVASYCLFLIGIHKIDSIKYDLDIKEFLK